jgi:3-phosphoshikimate 1-carboxyvinyltransferase
VDATGPLQPARLRPSLSKSDAQRAIVLGHALGCAVNIPPEGWPGDVAVLARGMSRLSSPGPVEIDCEDGGAPFRFLLAQAAILPGAHVRLVGTPRLGERPRAALIDALQRALGPHGFSASTPAGAPWPLEVRGATGTGVPRFQIDPSESSQFASSLVLAAAALSRREGRPWTVDLLGAVASAPYLDLTLRWVRAAGARVERWRQEIAVTAPRTGAALPPVPGDWSSIGYLLPIAWRTGSTVERVDLRAEHPDREIVPHLQSVGLALEERQGALAVSGSTSGSLDASGRRCPDLLPTLAALACVLPAPSRLRDVSILRGKESDRLEGIQRMVDAFGASSDLSGDELRIRPAPGPPPPSQPVRIDSRGDHRMAMAAATLAVLACCRLEISQPDCVAKSFPGFWTELEKVGVRLQPA